LDGYSFDIPAHQRLHLAKTSYQHLPLC